MSKIKIYHNKTSLKPINTSISNNACVSLLDSLIALSTILQYNSENALNNCAKRPNEIMKPFRETSIGNIFDKMFVSYILYL